MWNSEAYEEGYEAYKHDLQLGDNPFPYPSWEHDDWDKGWFDAEEDVRDSWK